MSQFIKNYFDGVPYADLRDISPNELFFAIFSHWKLASNREPEKALVRVYNPCMKSDGWDSDHTVIDIVNDDMPFLVDSITSELNRRNLIIHFIAHPVMSGLRGKSGNFEKLISAKDSLVEDKKESFIHLLITKQSSEQLLDIKTTIEKVLKDVRYAVDDWVKMREKMLSICEDLSLKIKNVSNEDSREAQDFLRWSRDDNFIFLGYRDYDFNITGKTSSISVRNKSGLGVLKEETAIVISELKNQPSIPPVVRSFINKRDLMFVTKTDVISNIHRPVHMDSIGIKRFDKKGKVVGQRVFVGLFTSGAYNCSPKDIPLLRLKLKKAFKRSGFADGSHDGKAFLNILETFPRDELFQVSDKQLFDTATGILHLQGRQRLALFVRWDDFERFASCLVYVPKDRFSTVLRRKIQLVLEVAFRGEQRAYYTQLGDFSLARLHIILKTTPGKIPKYNLKKIESDLIKVTRSWYDELRQELIALYSADKAEFLYERFRGAFMPAYQDTFDVVQAIEDIENIEKTFKSGSLSMQLYRPAHAKSGEIRFKVYHPDQPIPLSNVLPMLENMGLKVLDEHPFAIKPGVSGKNLIMIHDFGLRTRNRSEVKLENIHIKFQEAFSQIWSGEVESDGFNALVLLAGLDWRDVMVLRACCKYLRQAGIAFSQQYMEQTLCNNPFFSVQLIELFKARFDPRSNVLEKKIFRRLLSMLEKIQSADEDRILRRYMNLIMSMIRTNFFQSLNGSPKQYLSFKLDSEKVDELPLPCPLREIFVYSARFEGVHLRFGMVARGGLRWSDRREDFRTEILGLVKAQQVKNTVIVPVGSKGGFVLKSPPEIIGRQALFQEGVECYKLFISGMLDLTDNLQENAVIPPKDTIRKDKDDPYLVVAADKGTSTFSDIANLVSAEYGFWLGDAFASGGSDGYDHKKMGITARGAWESVKRHFREMGVNTQKEDFDVIGVGDMSGDVFGNGMLLSSHICLIGAFNHLHIFVDPEPNASKSLVERRRLFKKTRSSWTDYNKNLISKGGGIFERSAKFINLSPEIKKRFDISKDRVTPNELIRSILEAKTDLLWFGGIGTYVKQSTESHLDVGDRANDAIRIDAKQLNAKVVGEGANLGLTQSARIEAALNGVRLFADSIDNSAGVDCSDHEVNIKILIDQVVNSGGLSRNERNLLLAKMTKEVGLQVLVDNYDQTKAIYTILYQGMSIFDNQVRLMRFLEKEGKLNRKIEFLPDDELLVDRSASKSGLKSPEIAILMSYAKIWVNEELLASDLPDDPALQDDLIMYFPVPLRKKYKKEILNHRLSREIIATQATNSIINQVGGAFINLLMERTGMSVSDVVRSYIIARRCLGMQEIWDKIDALDNKVPAEIQTQMRLDTNQLIEWVSLWILRHGRRPLDIATHVDEFSSGFECLYACMEQYMPKHYLRDIVNRAKPFVGLGVPKDLANQISGFVNLFSGCDIIRMAKARKISVLLASKLYFAVGTRFNLGSLRAASSRIETQSHWQKLAVAALTEEIYEHQLTLTDQVLDALGPHKKTIDVDNAITNWVDRNLIPIARMEQLMSELSATEINDLSMIAVASRQLKTLAESPVI